MPPQQGFATGGGLGRQAEPPGTRPRSVPGAPWGSSLPSLPDQERKLCAHPRLEIYQQDQIYFMCPLARQGDFYVPEMKETERKSRGPAEASDARVDDAGAGGGGGAGRDLRRAGLGGRGGAGPPGALSPGVWDTLARGGPSLARLHCGRPVSAPGPTSRVACSQTRGSPWVWLHTRYPWRHRREGSAGSPAEAAGVPLGAQITDSWVLVVGGD